MQHVVAANAGTDAGGGVGDVALDHGEVVALVSGHSGEDAVDVLAVPGGKVVEHNDLLVQAQQGFGQVGADEASTARDEPLTWRGEEVGFELVVGGHGAETVPQGAKVRE